MHTNDCTTATDLKHDLDVLQGLHATPVETSGALRAILAEGLQTLSFWNLSACDRFELIDSAEVLQKLLFDCQMQLRAAIERWRGDALLGLEAERLIRDTFRILRNTIDLIGELATGHQRLSDHQEPLRAFDGGMPRCFLNPRVAPDALELQAGDVIVQRGRRHNSAAIARIGEIDSQFSHVAIVARAPTGELVAVEALIEQGAVITPLDAALSHGIGRAALYRHIDRGLAGRAAEVAYAYVRDGQTPAGSRILYDFSMELEGYRRLYCAKLVRFAFDRASRGEVLLPRYPTRLQLRNRSFLDQLGVTARLTFAPGDMDMEAGFELVAEWRDYRITSELRLKDFIMVKVFEWMDRYGYRFKPDATMRLIALLGRLTTHLGPGLQDLLSELVPKVPPNMTRRAIAAVAMLHQTAEPMYKELRQLEDETIRSTGFQLNPSQAFRALERYRSRHGDRLGYLAR